MNSTKITFLSGLETIGGNIVAIEHGKYRLIMDFGAIGGVGTQFLLDRQQTRTLLQQGLLPEAEGLYWHEAVADSRYKTIICLSHLHIDHVGSLKHIHKDIPVYAHALAVPFYHKLVENALLPDYDVHLLPVGEGEVLQHGPFQIRFFESDHDTRGVAAIFVQLPDMKLIHSGDVRLTGFYPEKVLHWVSQARKWQPDILLMEGTGFSHLDIEPNPIEVQVQKITQTLSSATELALVNKVQTLVADHSQELFAFNGYPQNVDRFLQFIRCFNRAGKRVVMEPAYYHLIEEELEARDQVECYSPALLARMQASPAAYALQVDEAHIDVLSQLPQGIYVHSNASPLGAFMKNYENFVKSIVEAGWTFYHANVSGHATPEDLLTIAYLVHANVTVPWHSFQPLKFAEALVERGLHVWCPMLKTDYAMAAIHQFF